MPNLGFSPDRIRVVMEDNCWSNVGREGGEQKLSLGDGCDTVYTAAHELGHSLGFFHTHTRHDRNEFIRVNRRNIDQAHLADFLPKTRAINHNYDVPFDFGSIMLYESTAFSKNRKPTMVPKDKNYIYTLGSPFISFYDIQMINLHYNCTGTILFNYGKFHHIGQMFIPDRCKPDFSAKCENGGFPHPRNCSRCICPGGYGGRLCNERVRNSLYFALFNKSAVEDRQFSLRDELEADSIRRTFKDRLGKLGFRPADDYEMCNYWIKAPQGKRIEVKLLSFQPDIVGVSGCKYDGVEIKTQADQRRTGYRFVVFPLTFCSPHAVNTVLVSNSNIVPIITYNSLFQSTERMRTQGIRRATPPAHVWNQFADDYKLSSRLDSGRRRKKARQPVWAHRSYPTID
uniref:Zinc metalloproteinase n=1 Tax=Heligmosomoides polygyrus TaxID=6339 RepID=A0A8L8KA65_HELPZ